MRTTTLRSSISSFGPFCSNGSEPRSEDRKSPFPPKKVKFYYYLQLLLTRPSWILGPLHPPMMETIRPAAI